MKSTNAMGSSATPLWARAILLFPEAIAQNLARVEATGLVPKAPTLGQLALGVLRMQFRLATRPDSVGVCTARPVRSTLRARLLEPRPMRFPFLVKERAVAPLDFSGLASTRERILRHLLGAHHDGNQFAYDLEMLAIHPGALEELRERTKAVISGADPRAAWLRDLCVYEGYHEGLLAAVETALSSGVALAPEEANDPDISFVAYLRWCAEQPSTLPEVVSGLASGRLSFDAYRPESVS